MTFYHNFNMIGLLVTIIVNGAYLAFYSGYSKATKQLDFNQLTEILTFKKGLDFTFT